jgi:hypothetical protein
MQNVAQESQGSGQISASKQAGLTLRDKGSMWGKQGPSGFTQSGEKTPRCGLWQRGPRAREQLSLCNSTSRTQCILKFLPNVLVCPTGTNSNGSFHSTEVDRLQNIFKSILPVGRQEEMSKLMLQMRKLRMGR